MTFKENVVSLIINKIAAASSQQRDIEDICKKFSLDPKDGKDYIAIEAYRIALSDLLSEIRRLDDGSKSSSNIRGRKRGQGI